MTSIPLVTSWVQVVGAVAAVLTAAVMVFVLVRFRRKLARLDATLDRMEVVSRGMADTSTKSVRILGEADSLLRIATGDQRMAVKARGDTLDAVDQIKKTAAVVERTAAVIEEKATARRKGDSDADATRTPPLPPAPPPPSDPATHHPPRVWP